MIRSAMASGHDRISDLPDSVLGRILTLMPIKPATSTSILSSRWRDLWKLIWVSATTLDFTGEFASRQSQDQLVAYINKCLQLHTGKKIRSFRLSLHHPAKQYQADVERWVEFAASRCVEELYLDFSPPVEEIYTSEDADENNLLVIPRCLFSSGSSALTHLTLSYCNLCLPLDFTSLHLLKSLSLRCVNIDDAILQGILSHSLLLEALALRQCQGLNSIEITSSCASLKRLVVVNCWELNSLKLAAAPAMESFHFYGEIYFELSFEETPSLVDAFICSISMESSEPEHDYLKLLSDLAHVRILTVCTATLARVTIWEEYVDEGQFPILLGNLEELQLLMDFMNPEHLSYIYGFFRLCPSPFLEKLFIRLPKLLEDPSLSTATQKITEGPQSVSFEHLKIVKMINFKGSPCEMELARFLLGKAPNLEYLVLVAPPKLVPEEYSGYSYPMPKSRFVENLDLRELHMQLLLLPRASSHVQFVVSEYLEDDSNMNPTHTKLDCGPDVQWFV